MTDDTTTCKITATKNVFNLKLLPCNDLNIQSYAKFKYPWLTKVHLVCKIYKLWIMHRWSEMLMKSWRYRFAIFILKLVPKFLCINIFFYKYSCFHCVHFINNKTKCCLFLFLYVDLSDGLYILKVLQTMKTQC